MSLPNTVTISTSLLTDLGDAVRAKTGGSEEMTLDEMATAVEGIKQDLILSHGYITRDLIINSTDLLRMGTNVASSPYRNNTLVQFEATGLTSFRFVTKFNCIALPSSSEWPAFYGADSTRKTPRTFLNSNGSVSSEWENNSGTRKSVGCGGLSTGTWYYYVLAYDDSYNNKIRAFLYDSNGQLLTSNESGDVGTLPTGTYSLNIATAAISGNTYLKQCKVDYAESFFERNGTVIWGNKTATNGTMGIPT